MRKLATTSNRCCRCTSHQTKSTDDAPPTSALALGAQPFSDAKRDVSDASLTGRAQSADVAKRFLPGKRMSMALISLVGSEDSSCMPGWQWIRVSARGWNVFAWAAASVYSPPRTEAEACFQRDRLGIDVSIRSACGGPMKKIAESRTAVLKTRLRSTRSSVTWRAEGFTSSQRLVILEHAPPSAVC